MTYEIKNTGPQAVEELIKFLQNNKEGIYFKATDRLEILGDNVTQFMTIVIGGADLFEGTQDRPKKYMSYTIGAAK